MLVYMLWIQLASASDPSAPAAPADEPQPAEIVVEKGYHPSRITAAEGEPLRLAFLRKEEGGCVREIVFPTLEIRRELPVGEVVILDLGRQSPGEIPFHCGMNMISGVVIVAPRK